MNLTIAEQLVEQLKENANAYYNGEAFISDEEYDVLRDQLEALAPEHPFLSTVGAPTIPGSKKVKHKQPMLSLNKVTTDEELTKWLGKIPTNVPVDDVRVIVEPKLDGASLELQYENGVLVAAVSRGDGYEGEDVLAAARKMQGVPSKLAKPITMAVYGEALLTYKSFEELEPGSAKNPRDVGNGILRRGSGEEAEFLTFYACSTNDGAGSSRSVLHALTDLGFQSVPVYIIMDDGEAEGAVTRATIHAIKLIQERRLQLDYQIDGAVIRLDDVVTYNELGHIGNRPRGAIAFKWAAETAITIVKGISLTVGHTGFIAPTAILSPIELAGVTIRNATLCNWDEIKRLGVAIGDTVEIKRAGEIIPKVIRVIKEGDNRGLIPEPVRCPVCGMDAGRKTTTSGATTAQTFCFHSGCAAKATGKIRRWLDSLNILGVGDKMLESMYESGKVKEVADLYELSWLDLAELPLGQGKVGEARAQSVIAEIAKKRRLELHEFIGSLGIPFLGIRKAEAIIRDAGGALDTLEAWFNKDVFLSVAEQCHITNVAVPIMAYMSSHFVHIWGLVATGIDILPPQYKPAVAKPAGSLVFVLTGKFDIPKAAVHTLITEAGHSYEEDMKKGVTHLVQADASSVSSKTKKAVKMGIEVIDFTKLEELLALV